MANIFREALEILNNKHDGNMTKEEAEIVSSAIIPLMILPQYNHVDLREGLEYLARIVEEARWQRQSKRSLFTAPRMGRGFQPGIAWAVLPRAGSAALI